MPPLNIAYPSPKEADNPNSANEAAVPIFKARRRGGPIREKQVQKFDEELANQGFEALIVIHIAQNERARASGQERHHKGFQWANPFKAFPQKGNASF